MKIIDKYLDKYYTKKFIRYLEDNVFIEYYLDRNYVFNDIGVEIQLKPKEYKDKYFKIYHIILYEAGLYYLLHYDNFVEEFRKNIEDFIKTFR